MNFLCNYKYSEMNTSSYCKFSSSPSRNSINAITHEKGRILSLMSTRPSISNIKSSMIESSRRSRTTIQNFHCATKLVKSSSVQISPEIQICLQERDKIKKRLLSYCDENKSETSETSLDQEIHPNLVSFKVLERDQNDAFFGSHSSEITPKSQSNSRDFATQESSGTIEFMDKLKQIDQILEGDIKGISNIAKKTTTADDTLSPKKMTKFQEFRRSSLDSRKLTFNPSFQLSTQVFQNDSFIASPTFLHENEDLDTKKQYLQRDSFLPHDQIDTSDTISTPVIYSPQFGFKPSGSLKATKKSQKKGRSVFSHSKKKNERKIKILFFSLFSIVFLAYVLFEVFLFIQDPTKRT